MKLNPYAFLSLVAAVSTLAAPMRDQYVLHGQETGLQAFPDGTKSTNTVTSTLIVVATATTHYEAVTTARYILTTSISTPVPKKHCLQSMWR